MLDPWKQAEQITKSLSKTYGTRSGWLEGRASGCPFCLARGRKLPRAGERVRVLYEIPQYSMGFVGREGTVIKREFIPIKPSAAKASNGRESYAMRSRLP
jgi:hypothetical protein